MPLQEQLRNDMKQSMKGKEKLRTGLIRMLLAEIKNAEISKQGELNQDEELKLLVSQAKRREESIEAYERGGREDLAQIEKQELHLIRSYLPKQLSKEEASHLIQKAIGEVEAKDKRDFGKIMKSVMPKLKGRFPGKEIKSLVEHHLSSL